MRCVTQGPFEDYIIMDLLNYELLVPGHYHPSELLTEAFGVSQSSFSKNKCLYELDPSVYLAITKSKIHMLWYKSCIQ